MTYETDGIERLNSLLRGEISAAETYKLAIENVEEGKHRHLRERLLTLLHDHGQHAQLIREEIGRLGGKADKTSGGWGFFARMVQGVSNLFGDTSALKALKEGEQHGLKEYEEATEEMTEPRKLIEALKLSQERHVSILDALIKTVEKPVEMRA
jgi:bacterioferritin (cytochrome b1)